MTPARQCIHCGETRLLCLRPYGPGGTDICLLCAFATPEREEATLRAIAAQSQAAEAEKAKAGEAEPLEGQP